MEIEAVAFVLGQHHDLQEPGVHQVGEGKVDQAVVTGERHGGLGPVERERHQPLAFPAGENDGKLPGHGGTVTRRRLMPTARPPR